MSIRSRRRPLPPLIAGPYLPVTDVRVGQVVRGWVRRRGVAEWGLYEVTKIRDGPVPWPMTGRSPGQLIVFGDLERAIRVESVLAVTMIFGCSRTWAELFRRALSVPRYNPGTRALWTQLAPKLHTAEARKRQREAMRKWSESQ